MLATTQDATHHYRARAAERDLTPDVELFLRTWGTERWAAGATQVMLIPKHLPTHVRNSADARRAEGWILVVAPNGALLTCYRRRGALRFVQRKAERCWRRSRKSRR
jgi:hypothetical protein